MWKEDKSVFILTGIWEYIEKTKNMVHDLESRVQKSKTNIQKIVQLMATWSKTPLFERKEEKFGSLLNLDDREERLEKRYSEIRQKGDQIHQLLKVISSAAILVSSFSNISLSIYTFF